MNEKGYKERKKQQLLEDSDSDDENERKKFAEAVDPFLHQNQFKSSCKTTQQRNLEGKEIF